MDENGQRMAKKSTKIGVKNEEKNLEKHENWKKSLKTIEMKGRIMK